METKKNMQKSLRCSVHLHAHTLYSASHTYTQKYIVNKINIIAHFYFYIYIYSS